MRQTVLCWIANSSEGASTLEAMMSNSSPVAFVLRFLDEVMMIDFKNTWLHVAKLVLFYGIRNRSLDTVKNVVTHLPTTENERRTVWNDAAKMYLHVTDQEIDDAFVSYVSTETLTSNSTLLELLFHWKYRHSFTTPRMARHVMRHVMHVLKNERRSSLKAADVTAIVKAYLYRKRASPATIVRELAPLRHEISMLDERQVLDVFCNSYGVNVTKALNALASAFPEFGLHRTLPHDVVVVKDPESGIYRQDINLDFFGIPLAIVVAIDIANRRDNIYPADILERVDDTYRHRCSGADPHAVTQVLALIGAYAHDKAFIDEECYKAINWMRQPPIGLLIDDWRVLHAVAGHPSMKVMLLLPLLLRESTPHSVNAQHPETKRTVLGTVLVSILESPNRSFLHRNCPYEERCRYETCKLIYSIFEDPQVDLAVPCDESGNTVLHFIAHLTAKFPFFHDLVVCLLCEKTTTKHVDPTAKNSGGDTPLMAYVRASCKSQRSFLASGKRCATIRLLLQKAGSHRDADFADYTGATPITLACKYEHIPLLQLLWDAGLRR